MTKMTSSEHIQNVDSQHTQSELSSPRWSISKNYKGYEITIFPKKKSQLSKKTRKWGVAVKSQGNELLPMTNHHIYDNPAVAFTAAMAFIDEQGE